MDIVGADVGFGVVIQYIAGEDVVSKRRHCWIWVTVGDGIRYIVGAHVVSKGDTVGDGVGYIVGADVVCPHPNDIIHLGIIVGGANVLPLDGWSIRQTDRTEWSWSWCRNCRMLRLQCRRLLAINH